MTHIVHLINHLSNNNTQFLLNEWCAMRKRQIGPIMPFGVASIFPLQHRARYLSKWLEMGTFF